MKVCGVIGGGISGLATCYYLSTLGKGLIDKVILLEASSKCGGWVSSVVDESGVLFEKGARSIRSYGNGGFNTIKIVEELGLSDHILPVSKTHQAAKNRFIYCKRKLHKLPNNVKSVFSTIPPFSKPLAWYAFKEIFQPRMSSSSSLSSSSPSSSSSSGLMRDDDYSIDSFFRSRFGPEVADCAVNPLCRGIYAGDSAKLSVKSCFRPLFDLEAKFGSVMLGSLLSKKKDADLTSGLVRRFKEEGWVSWSLRDGLQELTDALLKHLESSTKVEVKMQTPCTGLEFEGSRVQMRHPTTTEPPATPPLRCDHVFCALPSSALAQLCQPEQQALADKLEKIHSVNVGVVNLVYPSHIQPPHQGFGHLIPSFEDTCVMGMIYESCVFPFHNGPDNKTRFTVMLGGAWFDECVGGLSADECVRSLEEKSLRAMDKHLGIRQQPDKMVTNVLKECIPQYQVGHQRLLSQLSTSINNHQLPISLLGCSYAGVSVNDCIYNARKAVTDFLKTVK